MKNLYKSWHLLMKYQDFEYLLYNLWCQRKKKTVLCNVSVKSLFIVPLFHRTYLKNKKRYCATTQQYHPGDVLLSQQRKNTMLG